MRKTGLFFCGSFFLQFIVLSTSAQSYNYAFEHYTTDNGLSHDQVYCVLKDRRGFMWFGTRNGLNRFDGYSFKVFTRNEAEKSSLCCNTVTALAEDPYGLIWVSTSEGICILDPASDKFSTLNLPIESGDESSYREASNLAVDQQRCGWFERGKYLYQVDLKMHSWKRYLLPATNRNSNSVYVDRNNNIWVILQGALYRFDRETKTAKYYMGKDEVHAPSKTIITNVRNLSDGRLWMESWGQGLFYYDDKEDRIVDYPDANVVASSFSEDWDLNHQSFLWVGGEPNGLAQFYFKEGQYQFFKKDIREPYSHNG
ncbi:MAG: ligand-binding sensor domain-containing protein, partial [Bacteroidia bacterium]